LIVFKIEIINNCHETNLVNLQAILPFQDSPSCWHSDINLLAIIFIKINLLSYRLKFSDWIAYRLYSVKKIICGLFCCLAVCFSRTSLQAQETYCKNLGFEMGDFTNWTGYNWIYSTEVPSVNTSKVQVSLPAARRQVILSDATAYDANTGNALKIIPSGYKYVARLGDAILGGDPNPRCWEQSLRYTMTIDSTNALLVMKFALVLQYASDHTARMEPRFKLTLFDQNGDTIPDCANYDVYSSNGNVKGFRSYTPAGSTSPVEWRDWTTVGANLLKYYGHTITLEFMSADCTGRYHYGYAYFTAACHPLYITVKYCAGDSVASLAAPEGFEQYNWMNSSGAVIDTSKTLIVANPVEGAVYSCKMTSATGCTVSLQSTIVKYVLKADFNSSMIDCKSNKVQLINLASTTHGSLNYLWDFGDGDTTVEVNPQHTFSTSGMHDVSLSLENPPSTCTLKLTKKIESFSPPLVGISGESTYCPGLSIYLKAYGAYDYTWSTGSKADSVKVGDPGGKFWLLGRSSTGCVSDTIYITISQDMNWEFSDQSDTVLCHGENAVLSVSGATNYLWNTGDKTATISVTSPGTYKVTGTNARGCQKTRTIQVTEFPVPGADFTLSASAVDARHNKLNCTVSPQADVTYTWDMGDGLTETGPAIQHTYSIPNANLSYTITLKAVSREGCTSTVYKTVEVIPFVPNVFSPNGDNINDLFMAQMDLKIFDRNGLLLYQGLSGWDGNYLGKALDPDTYFYLITYRDNDQKIITLKGYVTLVR
jgi:gliding motility-associated-like protein